MNEIKERNGIVSISRMFACLKWNHLRSETIYLANYNLMILLTSSELFFLTLILLTAKEVLLTA